MKRKGLRVTGIDNRQRRSNTWITGISKDENQSRETEETLRTVFQEIPEIKIEFETTF